MGNEHALLRSRRRFLATGVAVVGVVGLASSLGGCGGGTSQPIGRFDEGAVTEYEVGTFRLDTTAHVIVARDATGLYAYSSLCTHEQCDVDAPVSNGTATCRCHGSVFDGNGNVLQGPANRPLPHFAVSV